MEAHSPTGSVALPGTIIDTLTSSVEQASLTENYYPNFNNTGNAAILLGAKKDQIDLLVDAHLDKPTFGVADVVDAKYRKRAALFACCANRFPQGRYQIEARALRYDESKQIVAVCGRGVIQSYRAEGLRNELFFEAYEGEIDYTDLVVFDTLAQRQTDGIAGPGLDDGAGVTILLATASILREIESLLEAKSLNCLFTFSDQEEWPAESFFAQGASKTTFALRPPTFGSIVVDVHTAGEGYPIKLGNGISCGFVSAQGKGAIMPLPYQRLTAMLISDLNGRAPQTAQHNTGYFSRSDDYALMRWSRMLGLLGIPAVGIHSGKEEGHLGDVRGGIIFLSHYIPVVLGLSSTLADQYQLLNRSTTVTL
jgi:putative aminopeptidase FrvX